MDEKLVKERKNQAWTMHLAPRRPALAPRDVERMPTQALHEECKQRGLPVPKPDDKNKSKVPIRDRLIELLCADAEIDVIEDAGAVGDLSADDSLAIQSAMNAMRDGQVLRFPPGRYLVEHLTLPAGVSITLAGPEPDDSSGKKAKDRQKKAARGQGSAAVLQLKEDGRFIFSTAALPVIMDEPDKPQEQKKLSDAELMEQAKERERQRDIAAGKPVEEETAADDAGETDSVCGGSDLRPGIELLPGDGSTIDNRPVAAERVLRKYIHLRNLTLEGPHVDKPPETTIGGVRCEDTQMHKQAWQSKLTWQNKGGGNTAFPSDKLNGSKLSSGKEPIVHGIPFALSV
jgi:hypothetical protein